MANTNKEKDSTSNSSTTPPSFSFSSSQLYTNTINSHQNICSPNFSNLITINPTNQITIKLTSSNYSSCRFKFHVILVGEGLMIFIDGSHPFPSSILKSNDGEIPNPDYISWVQQDQLIFSAIAGSITPTLVPFIVSSKTSKESWKSLAHTYAKSTRGRLNQLKERLRLLNKGTKTTTEYLKYAKSIADELVMCNTSFDHDDFTLKILGGLKMMITPDSC